MTSDEVKKGNYENGDEAIIHDAMPDAVSTVPVREGGPVGYHDHDGDWEKVKSGGVTTPRKDGANQMTTNRYERDGVCSNSALFHGQYQLEFVNVGLVKAKTVEETNPNAYGISCPVKAISLSNL